MFTQIIVVSAVLGMAVVLYHIVDVLCDAINLLKCNFVGNCGRKWL